MSGADASLGEVVDLNEGPARNIQRILEWVDQFGCLRADGANDVPCKGDDAEICVVCASSYMLGCGEERHAQEQETHEQRQQAIALLRPPEGA